MPKNIQESGAGERTLKPGGGSASGDNNTRSLADLLRQMSVGTPEEVNKFSEVLSQIGKEADMIGGGSADKNRNTIKAKPSLASVKGMVKEDLAAIYAAEGQTLSEEALDKMFDVFQAAVEIRVVQESAELEEEMEAISEERFAARVAEMDQRVDDYMEHLAEEFMERNQAVIEEGAEREQARALLAAIRNVLSEANVTIDEANVDAYAQLETRFKQLQESHNQVVAQVMEANSREELARRNQAVNEATAGLVDSQGERLRLLSEALEFDDKFEAKLETLKAAVLGEGAAPSTPLGLIAEDADQFIPESAGPARNPDSRVASVASALRGW